MYIHTVASLTYRTYLKLTLRGRATGGGPGCGTIARAGAPPISWRSDLMIVGRGERGRAGRAHVVVTEGVGRRCVGSADRQRPTCLHIVGVHVQGTITAILHTTTTFVE